MRKKILIIPIVVISLLAFGTVSSAHAFVGLTALTIALASGFITTVLAAEGIKHSKAESAKKEKEKQEVKQKTQDVKQVSGLKAQMAAEAH
jgi:hypothetical protein